MPTFAKLTLPKTHRVLRRERLFSLVELARERPLVRVSGPPGAGKLTLVASYVDARKGRAEDANHPDEAIECYLRGLDADPVIEQFYQGLMRCYTALERRSEALSAYQRLKRMLSISLGVQPSVQTERLYQRCKRQAVGG